MLTGNKKLNRDFARVLLNHTHTHTALVVNLINEALKCERKEREGERDSERNKNKTEQISGKPTQRDLPGAQLCSKNLLTLYSSPRQSGAIVMVARRRPIGMSQPRVEFRAPWQLRLPLRSAIEFMLALLLMITTDL